MKTCGVLLAACCVAGVCAADDLAWKFDVSARPADVFAESSAPNSEAVDASANATDAGDAIAFFDSRSRYSLLSDGWAYRFVPGFLLFLR